MARERRRDEESKRELKRVWITERHKVFVGGFPTTIRNEEEDSNNRFTLIMFENSAKISDSCNWKERDTEPKEDIRSVVALVKSLICSYCKAVKMLALRMH